MQPAPSDERTSMSVLQYLVFLKWLLYSCLIGIVVGGVAISFHYGIDWATQLRGAHPNVIFFLPLGGVAIVLFYRACHMEKDRGTNLVLVAVREAEPDVVLVCLGAPKQELWMAEYGPSTGARLMVGLGGSLDVFAGVTERAPEAWQKLGLEWAYRLKKEPKRIGRMAKLPLVLVKAAGQRIRPDKKGDA